MPTTPLAVGLLLGLGANLLADRFLARDPLMRRPWGKLNPAQRISRLARWLISTAALAACTAMDVGGDRLIALALMTVTAITDLECRILPPPRFIYASVVASLALAGLARGLDAGLDAAVAQGLCFSVGVFIALWGRHRAAGMDPGDIRALMQMGATAGSLAGIALAVVGVSAVGLILVLAGFATHRRVTGMPLATLAWCGLVLIPVTLAVLRGGIAGMSI